MSRLIVLILALASGCANRYTTRLFKPGIKYCKTGHYEGARDCFMQVYHSGDSTSYFVVSALGTVYLRMEQYDSAKLFLDRATEDTRSGDDANLNSNMAYYFWMNQKKV